MTGESSVSRRERSRDARQKSCWSGDTLARENLNTMFSRSRFSRTHSPTRWFSATRKSIVARRGKASIGHYWPASHSSGGAAPQSAAQLWTRRHRSAISSTIRYQRPNDWAGASR
eukprot:2320453-Prymnesium_polylepis.1